MPTQMPFGRWKGTRLRDLPADYFAWLETIETREPLRSAVKREAERRRAVALRDIGQPPRVQLVGLVDRLLGASS